MKVHVLTYGNTYGGVYVTVFTDANLELAQKHALSNADPADTKHCLRTVEVDDPEEIAILKEEIQRNEEAEATEEFIVERAEDQATFQTKSHCSQSSGSGEPA